MSADPSAADPVRRRRVVVLGATGSIGENTLDVIARHPDRFQVFALSAKSRTDRLMEQCRRHGPRYAVVEDVTAARDLAVRLGDEGLATEVLAGPGALAEVAGHDESDIVVTGIVGAAGLLPTLAAVSGPRRVLVANKEPLVMMGRAIVEAAANFRATVIPLDSEHNAIYQCLPSGFFDADANSRPGVRRIILTASGGPFRTLSAAELKNVTPVQAVAHPNWVMGPKISVDSATLMNKGLELIEACVLFDLPVEDVGVVIHPQSTVHSMVEFVDGSVIAQMGASDMRIPIAHGLGWPDRIESGARCLDFFAMNQLDFERPDEVRFPCLALAREAARTRGSAPVVLNAANEVAVESFLAGRIPFTAIPAVIEEALQFRHEDPGGNLEAVLDVDRRARAVARDVIESRHGA